MSATIGTGLSRTISLSARVEPSSGQETRTMSAPASAHACTCAIVPATSVVSVLVMVCTLIGAPPPTATGPTWIRRDGRRSMLRQGRMGLWVIDRAIRAENFGRNIGEPGGNVTPAKARSPPDGIEKPMIWAGNSGSVYVRVGETLHGPLGSGTKATRDVVLEPQAIVDRYEVVSEIPEVISQAFSTQPAGVETAVAIQ